MDIEQKLAKIGIDGKAAKLYLAALELGDAPVNEVAIKADLSRTTAYDVLDKLQQEGLVTLSEKSGKRHVIAEDPVVLLHRIEIQKNTLTELLPQLRSAYNRALAKPEIRFYEGIEGVKTVLRDTLTCQSKKLRGILSMEELIEVPGLDVYAEYIKERVANKIHLKVLRSAGHDTLNIWSTSPEELRELRYAPDSVELSMTTYLYDEKVALISSKKENYGMIIQSQEFFNLQSALFDTLWGVSLA